ncbi:MULTISPECIES: UDP-N-acetylmuramoyl-L-alanine--D-glutamate ligase [unclassified Coleofasciculus]|uniref:UDP-N-acetylmuramoyl-L-alanine--D-glutamate ligase n=1 Tax=Cyanophyceae TaxID=3028117 RepID=UPI0016877E5D|nr:MULTISPECIES: UDP-N-acetylmuramoyl-L-alanine--D-glutamate ligase [unclassified Coleofasciculus]MBD1881023.1 UDP-N-acetylmuramoyl-L-alanine--D-glutamate ligase [Coleofasciculus sp. FACHB-T130]MBD1900694.1 UDP-N-acetylmuramoyl-L-alanine--D-glutamate ligase [Coleofasciculus sp. FACHB-125]
MPIAHIIGLGKSGIAAARLLKREGWAVTISDRNSSENLRQEQQQLANEGIDVKLGYSLELNGSDLPQMIVVSPGVPWDAPILIEARKLGIETIGEIELAWRYLQSCPWVGITGTNGKTTTTALVAAIFQAAGFHAPACGNIGYAAGELALAEKPPDWVIAELSSYQIESSATVAPKIGVWTTFTPDHLSRHKTLENYYNIKAHLLSQSQQQVLNGDDPELRKTARDRFPNAYWTSVNKADLIGEKGFYIEDGWVVETQMESPQAEKQGEKIVQASALRMVGEHNLQNLLMAVATARLAGIEKEAIQEAITNFPGVPHRLEHICTLAGIDFINDSKATNYDAAQVGLASVNSPAILIAGGEAKAGDDTSWLETIQTKATAVLLIGDAATVFSQRLQDVGYSSYEIVQTMEKAVSRAAELAQAHGAKVVLLSPACASFDQYQNFEQRGDHFRQLCLELL